MFIPDLLRPSDDPYYTHVHEPRNGWPNRDTIAALRKSLDKAHDNLRRAVRENDRLRLALLTLNKRQRWTQKLFIGAITFTWAVLGAIIKFLLPYAIHGMQMSK